MLAESGLCAFVQLIMLLTLSLSSRYGRVHYGPMNSDELLSGQPFPDRLDAELARKLVELARSSDPKDVDHLVMIGMTRGLRHVRLAIDSVSAQRSLALEARSVRLAHLLLWATVAAALAAVANVVAVLLLA